MKAMYLQASVSFVVVALLTSSVSGAVCPDSCICSTTRDGLHRAACSNIADLYKFTLRQKHHNINILDLSHNNITRLSHELDRLTEVVTLDLSTNGIAELNKFLHNEKKLVHLNLANNRIQELSLSTLPTSVSSLDLTNNLLRDVPYDLEHLRGLEHLELEGNPLDCSCDNILARNRLLSSNVFIDSAKCATPRKLKDKSWLELKTNDICKSTKIEDDYLDMMMGDQPSDAIRVGEETSALKSLPLVASNDLEDGGIIQDEKKNDDDDSLVFLRVDKSTASPQLSEMFEGSGEGDSTTVPNLIEPRYVTQSISMDEVVNTEDPEEGSGEGSGFAMFDFEAFETTSTTTTPEPPPLYTGPVEVLIPDDNSTEFPVPPQPNVYEGGRNWHSENFTVAPTIEEVSTEKPVVTPFTRDTTVSEPIRITQSPDVSQSSSTESHSAPHKTGTYVCIAIIVILLVGLIGFAIVKGQIRKRRDRRILRQQKRDVEKASKEMVDMNKSLLGKPAVIESPIEKKQNGKYELVPTHEPHQKKGENGGVGNGIKPNDTDVVRTDSPRDTNQNKSSSKDNNLTDDHQMSPNLQDSSFESDAASPYSRKDTNSLSSEDIFVPLNDDDSPKANGLYSDISQPLLNGDQNTLSDFLSPSHEYVPVYSPDMGRVRIKVAETPKPKTPVLVTRSRSNAGDIIITPSVLGNTPKSTT